MSITKLEPSEKQIEALILDWLNHQKGVVAYKNNSTGYFDATKGFFRKRTGKYQERGSSDIVGSFRGRALFIEVKSKRGRPTEEQKAFLENMARTGAIAFLARSLEDVKRQLAGYLPAALVSELEQF
jgi:hypothetical protein